MAPVTTVGSAVSDVVRQQMYEERKEEKRERAREKHSWEQRSEEEDRKIKAGELRESKSLTGREFGEDPGSGGKDKAFLHQHLK